jgi:hypothetical protein
MSDWAPNVPAREEFLALSTSEIARQVRQAGPQVCVFPINGTRRWAWLEHEAELSAAPQAMAAYMDLAGREYVRLFALLFEHGVDTILSPVFGRELLGRGDAYVQAALGAGMRQFVESPAFTDFYRAWGVRARIYGDLDSLRATPYEFVLTLAQRLAETTADGAARRLFLGVFADHPWEQLARLTVEHYRQYGRAPTHAELVTAYYGEYVPPVTLFLGFDKPAVYDYPLLASGQEDLYFTLAPSPYLDATTLRLILYDHLYTRRAAEPDWSTLPLAERRALRACYRRRRRKVQGIGRLLAGAWVAEG